MADELLLAFGAVLAIPAFTLAAVACLSVDPRRGAGRRRTGGLGRRQPV